MVLWIFRARVTLLLKTRLQIEPLITLFLLLITTICSQVKPTWQESARYSSKLIKCSQERLLYWMEKKACVNAKTHYHRAHTPPPQRCLRTQAWAHCPCNTLVQENDFSLLTAGLYMNCWCETLRSLCVEKTAAGHGKKSELITCGKIFPVNLKLLCKAVHVNGRCV